MTDLESVARQLGISDAIEGLRSEWEEAISRRPAGPLFFLDPSFVRAMCASVSLAEPVAQGLLATAERVAADEALRTLSWYFHYRLFLSPGPRPKVNTWPLLTAALDGDAGNFNVLLLLSGTPQLLEIHRRHGIPADVARATMLDLELCLRVEDYTEDYGRYGISPRILGWLMNHWRGNLYRLGRLQFIPAPAGPRLHVFRHRDGRAVALSDGEVAGRPVRPDSAAGVQDAPTAAFRETQDAFFGAPIHPRGFLLGEQCRLRKSDWRPALAPGDPVLQIHIPAGEPMDYQACGASLRQAREFFPRHFPGSRFLGFTCGSWLLDPQFENLLAPTSNLVRFQKEVYLFPIPPYEKTTLDKVFGRKRGSMETWPHATSMQRAFLAHLRRGGHFRGGGCFLLADDVAWGSQVYRRNWVLTAEELVQAPPAAASGCHPNKQAGG